MSKPREIIDIGAFKRLMAKGFNAAPLSDEEYATRRAKKQKKSGKK